MTISVNTTIFHYKKQSLPLQNAAASFHPDDDP